MTDIAAPPIPSGPTQVQLPPDTLGGAIGCDWSQALGELVFVEYSGKLSRMKLTPSPSYAVLGSAPRVGGRDVDRDPT